ncbi:MAG: T9SS type A sorting domain-containing protein [Chitinophagaceae bacterium]|nr:T9SS type A sorting domain-containing protein [Chitinophagaceae bacterium]
MKKAPKQLLLCILFLLVANIIFAQTNKFYSNTASGISKKEDDVTKNIKKFRLVKQNISAIQSFRQSLPLQHVVKNKQVGVISIPLETNADVQFSISPVKTLSEEAESIFPYIQTYTGISADGKMKLRLTLSQLGMMGSVKIQDEGSVHYFTILDNQQPDVLISFNATDVVAPVPFTCGADDMDILQGGAADSVFSKRASGDCRLHTYRFAVSATGEYTQWAGSQANAVAYITNTVNNINEVFENDFTIHLSLIAQLSNIYTDTAADPFITGKVLNSNTLTQNNNALNNNTGAVNYDVGIVFGYGWSGGLAGLNVTCTGSKGQAGGGLNSGFPLGSSGPIFDNVIAHEVGHQFSATHTMAASNGGCGSNINAATGWEPGGGSTIMAYAGTCSGNSYQSNSDNYFHGGSIAQVQNFLINGNGRLCGTATASGNNAPTVTVSSLSYNIPNSTPFILTANAADADVNNMLTFNWEQMDAVGGSGISTPPQATSTSGPQFRSFIPAVSATRYFPQKEVILNRAVGTYEVLPTVARTLNFKVTVRDNNEGAGCNAYEDVVVNVQSCGAFEITNLSTPQSFVADGINTMTLTWNTATVCSVMPKIDILFSTDGGVTYPYTVLSETANDGTETFIVPNLPTNKGRFMIKSIGNIYYNINAADIIIASGCIASGTAITPSADFSAPGAGHTSLNLTESPMYGSSISFPVTGVIASTDLPGQLSFYDDNISSCTGPSNNNNYDVINFYPSVTGSYTFRLVSPTPGGIIFHIYIEDYLPYEVCTNFIASSGTKLVSGGNTVTLSNEVTATLTAGLKYVLVVSSFSNSYPTLPANYSINMVSTPAGAAVYSGKINPGLNYNYVIVDNSTGNIVEIKNVADLRDHTKYLTNGTYTVYGISSNATAATLSTGYAGKSFNVLRTDVNEQAGSLCAQLSSNSRKVMIGNAVLPADLLTFYATLLNDHKASVSWKTSFEHAIQTYIVERSIDGILFNAIGNVVPFNLNSSAEQAYTYIDKTIPSNTGKVFYRLNIQDIDGTKKYSSVVTLQLNKKWAARIYPNPVQHAALTVFIDALSPDNTVLQVVDISGRIVLSKQQRLNKGANKILLPVQPLTNGRYLLRINGMEENAVLNFIIR